MRNFRDLAIWQRSFAFVKEVYLLTNKLPAVEVYGLKSQMKRAAVSIPSNIAEGCGRNSDVDLNRFLSIAMGSAYELETQLLLTNDMYKTPGIDILLNEVNELQRMIAGYKR